MKALAFIAALLVIAAAATNGLDAKDEGRISIVVLAAGSQDEFTDPSFDRADSAIDIIEALKKSKVVRLVKSEADAVIVVEVLARESKNRVTPFGGTFGQKSESTVRVRLIAGGAFSTEFEGSRGGNGAYTDYRGAARVIAKQIDEWAQTNIAKLRTLKPAWHPAPK